jgi:hypothetical protein
MTHTALSGFVRICKSKGFTILFELFAIPVPQEPHTTVLAPTSRSSCMNGTVLLVTAQS